MKMTEGRGTGTAEHTNELDEHPPGWKRLWGWTEFGKKTGWQWLELSIVPAVLLIGGFLLTASQEERAIQAEDRRAAANEDSAQKLAQDATLQAYLDQVGQLILDQNLLSSTDEDAVFSLAQARTSTVVARLDDEENASVVRFLSDAGLTGAKNSSISVLEGIDLRRTDLKGVELFDANLHKAFLLKAQLNGALFDLADLSESNLGEADLTYATMIKAGLRKANLQRATLRNVVLTDADLSGAFLLGTDLSGADLRGANLKDVVGISNERLEQQAGSLEEATMPDGSTHP